MCSTPPKSVCSNFDSGFFYRDCCILNKWRQREPSKNHHDPESKVPYSKRWHPGFTDCQQEIMMSLERQVTELANFKALAQLRQKY